RSAPVSATSSSSSPSASSIREKPSRMSPVRCDCRSLLTMRAASADVHLRLELERRDLAPIALELLALVREHVAEHGLAERLGDELAVLHRRHGLVERDRQRLVAERPALALVQRPHVVG